MGIFPHEGTRNTCSRLGGEIARPGLEDLALESMSRDACWDAYIYAAVYCPCSVASLTR